MENIVKVFHPWVDSRPELDICRSAKFGWVCIDKSRTGTLETFCRFAEDRQQLLTVLCAWFFDRAEADTWKGAADQALTDMAPYTAQLPGEDAEMVRTILGLYAKMEDAAP